MIKYQIDMKIKIKALILMILLIGLGSTLILPSKISEDFSAQKSYAESFAEFTEIANHLQLASISGSGKYRLKDDIEIPDGYDWTPIGSKDNPFTGVFDGNGRIIKGLNITSNYLYQGLFGYTQGAVIKNVKIEGINYSLDTKPEGEYFVGAVVGYADASTTIQNCEVENNFDGGDLQTISYKATIGGFVGFLTGGSEVKNVVNYKDLNFKENLNGAYITKVGGIAGNVSDSSSLENVANFGNVSLLKEDVIKSTNYVGGIAGEVSGALTTIINAVSASNVEVTVDVTVDNDLDKNYFGSIAGYISNIKPNNGNISSVAYIKNTTLQPYGYNLNYQANSSLTNDYVALLPENSVTLPNFYFAEEFSYTSIDGVLKKFKWYSLSAGWSENLWLVNVLPEGNELRLQMFQTFQIKLSPQLDYNGLLESVGEAEETYKYGKYANFRVKLKEDQNNGFYKINGILLEGKPCESEYLEDGLTQTRDVAWFEDNGEFVLSVRANSFTAGSFSFEVSALSFVGKVYVDSNVGGGVVKFGSGSAVSRNFTKDSDVTTAQAKAGSIYVFKNWNLYYKSTQSEAVENGEIKEGYLEIDGVYFKKKSPIYSLYEDENNFKYASSVIEFGFGKPCQTLIIDEGDINQNYFNQDFLLEAVFELDPYKLSFKKSGDYSDEFVKKIEVNGVDISSTNNVASVGKADIVEIKIYLAENYSINQETLLASIQDQNSQPTVTILNEGDNVLVVKFNTNKLNPNKMDSSERNKFIFELLAVKNSDNSNSKLAWIIGGSIGGAVVLGVGIFLVVWFTRGGRGGGPSKSLSKRERKKAIDEEYKRYYL